MTEQSDGGNLRGRADQAGDDLRRGLPKTNGVNGVQLGFENERTGERKIEASSTVVLQRDGGIARTVLVSGRELSPPWELALRGGVGSCVRWIELGLCSGRVLSGVELLAWCLAVLVAQVPLERLSWARLVECRDFDSKCGASTRRGSTVRKLEYILGYRMRTIPKKDRSFILSMGDLKRVRQDLSFKEVTYNDQRLLVCYNPERALLDAEKRENILNRIRKKIKNGSILSVVDNPNYKKFLKIQGQIPKIDPEAIERDATYDGMYVLTSNTKLPAGSVIETYKGLWQVEHAFRNLKMELEMGPIYHWKDDRIRAHVMICFLALVLRTVFYKKLRIEDPKVSYQEVFSSSRNLEAIGMIFKNKSVVLRTEPKPLAQLAFRALKMTAPPRIVSNSAPLRIKNVVPRHPTPASTSRNIKDLFFRVSNSRQT